MSHTFIFGKNSTEERTSPREEMGKIEAIVTTPTISSEPKKKEIYKGELDFTQFLQYEVLVNLISTVYPLKAKEFSLTNPLKRDFIKAVYVNRNIKPKELFE